MNTLELAGKTVAVTGAAGRLGRHIVAELEVRGANIAAIVMNADEARLVPASDAVRVEAFTMDVTDSEDVAKGFEDIASRFAGLDGLIHTVGGWGMTPILDTPAAEWQQLVTLNLTSAYLCFQQAARVMSAGSGGVLVAIASGQGADRGVGGQSAYSAGKAGVVRLVEAAADELAEQDIRAHAVAPSMILFDPSSTEEGVPVGEVVRACLAGFDTDPPPSGAVLRVYGSLG